jgi:hypothetical protein
MGDARFQKHEHDNEDHIVFHCPGCDFAHSFRTRCTPPNKPVWKWDGDLILGTFSPSLLVRFDNQRCHSFVKEGKIQFLSDCTHDLAGTTVDVPQVENASPD